MATSSGPAGQPAQGWSSVEAKQPHRLARPDISRALLGGFLGTAAMTMMMYFVAPRMLGHPMDIAEMLGSMLGGNWWAGMILHFINGTLIFPLIYAYFLFGVLPGAAAVKGTIWGVALWLLAQVIVMPLVGAGFFSGSMMAAMSSCVGHLVYGALVGWVGGPAK